MLMLVGINLNVNAQTYQGDTALHIALANDDWSIIKYLMSTSATKLTIRNNQKISVKKILKDRGIKNFKKTIETRSIIR